MMPFKLKPINLRDAKPKLTPPILAFLLVFAIGVYILMIHPRVGMADNGDFYRIMVSNDLAHMQERPVEDFFSFFNSKFHILQYYNPLSQTVTSTHSIVIQGALSISKLFGNTEIFDIGFLAMILLTVLATAVALLVREVCLMIKPRWLQYTVAVIAVILFADTGYMAYFNSFFGESVAYPFFLLSVAAFLRIARCRGLDQFWALIIFTTSTIMFMGSKNQFAASGILAALMLLILTPMVMRRQRKLIAVTCLCILSLLVATKWLYQEIDDQIYLINKYHSVTRGLTLHDPQAAKHLEALSIDKRYEMLKGSIFFDYTPLIDPKDPRLLEEFYAHYDLVKLTKFYLLNPDQLSRVLIMGGKNSFSIRSEVIGNYERSAGKQPAVQSNSFTLWSSFKDKHLPHKFNFLVLVSMLSLVIGLHRIYQNRLGLNIKQRLVHELTWLYVMGIGLSQILVSVIGAGDTDLKKHLFMVNVAFDCLIFYNLVYILSEFNQTSEK